MIFWLIIGGLTAAAVAYLVSPLMPKYRVIAGLLILCLPLAAIALYWWLGHPELTDTTVGRY